MKIKIPLSIQQAFARTLLNLNLFVQAASLKSGLRLLEINLSMQQP
jgi:hypothetical protein